MEEYTRSRIEQIVKMTSQLRNIQNEKKGIDAYLFAHYCEKGYLSECEPEYCIFRYNGSCRYIHALHDIYNEFGISLKD